MCGIFGIICYNNYDYQNKLNKHFIKGYKRGPEFSILKHYDNIHLGFHRLAINGLNPQSNQPFEIDNIYLICNGEIYNYKELALQNNITLTTDSDCEIILHLYQKFGIEYTLNVLDGVFAFILYDYNNKTTYIARDPYGIRPLYYFIEHNTIGFSSTLASIYSLVNNKKNINNFIPGNYMVINNQTFEYNFTKYTYFPCRNIEYDSESDLYKQIVNYVSKSVKKRVIGTTERPIACLLSGGLDSSLIAALVNKEIQNDNTKSMKQKKLQTFSIGLEGSEDLKYAKIVANHLQTKHHEIVVSNEDFFNAIPEVIKNIESYDTTSVRASVGNYLIGKYIKENSDCKVIFNGDGADELMGGYLYFKKAPNAYEFDKECKRLLQDIYMYDVLRSDRCISNHGLEPRTPFLDRGWVEFYLSIDRQMRYNSTINKCEKYLIRQAFDTLMPELLPKEILWRTKEAFSDGVSSLKKPWFSIIQDKIEENVEFKENINKTIITYSNLKLLNNPTTHEKAYYRYLFNKHYILCDHLISYYWMPKYVDAKDASARTLHCYNENNSNKFSKNDEKLLINDEKDISEITMV
jgi:asparagine synthase (glutamine-hydrolysing)